MLLAALNAPGRSLISQATLTRDHTERMLTAFGADISVEPLPGGGEVISLLGEAELKGAHVDVPRDPSSAAFPLVAALIVPGSEVTLPAILLNPRRAGLIETLREMGADIVIGNERISGGEKIGDLTVRHSVLKGVDVPAARVPAMIDEFPVLSVAAAFAEGDTVMHGLDELRLKETDRLAAILAGLGAAGVTAEGGEDRLVVHGRGAGGVPGGGHIATGMDHRIAMSFLVMGLASRGSMSVDDASVIATSFPEFEHLMRHLGAQFEAVTG
jgi:3-phosphoshikimate 1-carboxyvinyltransferase